MIIFAVPLSSLKLNGNYLTKTLITLLPISVEWHCKKSPLGFIFIKQTSFKEANGGIYSNASFVPTK